MENRGPGDRSPVPGGDLPAYRVAAGDAANDQGARSGDAGAGASAGARWRELQDSTPLDRQPTRGGGSQESAWAQLLEGPQAAGEIAEQLSKGQLSEACLSFLRVTKQVEDQFGTLGRELFVKGNRTARAKLLESAEREENRSIWRDA